MVDCFCWALSEASQSEGSPRVLGRRKQGAAPCGGRCHVCGAGERGCASAVAAASQARGAGWRPRGSEVGPGCVAAMAVLLRAVLLGAVLGCAAAALIPAADVKVEVLQKPFICHRRTKWGDMMLVHYEGYLERDGSMFHST